MRPFFSGLGASLAIGAGYVPIAFSFGLTAVEAGLTPATTLLISAIVFAGASQFVLVALLLSGASLWAALGTVVLMNARHIFYGPALATHLHTAHVPAPLLAFGLTDEVFATAMSRIDRIEPSRREGWCVGLQLGAYTCWLVGTALGAAFGSSLRHGPAALRDGLSFVLPALFFALLLESNPGRHRVAIASAGIAAAALSAVLPSYHALAIAIVIGAVCHAAGEQR